MAIKGNPLVSIIIPVYNGSNFLKQAIDSAINQTYKNTEIIVINDGSSDEGKTEEIIKSYGDKVRYFYKENGGVSSALNLGIANMKGEYFSWLSHDDKYFDEKVEKQVEMLKSNGDEEIIAVSSVQYIDENSSFMGQVRKVKGLNEGINETDVSLFSLLAYGSFNGCSLLIPKSAFIECGSFDEKLRYSQDAFMWAKMLFAGYKLCYTEEPLVYGRIHKKQLTQTGRSLFYSDSLYCAEYVIPKLLETGNKKTVYGYAVHNAKLNNVKVIKKLFAEDKEYGLLSSVKKLKIRFVLLYGKIRPSVKKIYYKILKGKNK